MYKSLGYNLAKLYKAYTHTEDLYIRKDDFLKIAKSKKVESYQDICSLLDSNRYNFSYLYIPPRIPISNSKWVKRKGGFVLL